ncbi:hypothetical protein C8J57DRAFT_1567305 [Mycena rebaudengoi]|nr:hypothetical protein C8J57DRAFT_1567305 [Mycena rebaudengoi]
MSATDVSSAGYITAPTINHPNPPGPGDDVSHGRLSTSKRKSPVLKTQHLGSLSVEMGSNRQQRSPSRWLNAKRNTHPNNMDQKRARCKHACAYTYSRIAIPLLIHALRPPSSSNPPSNPPRFHSVHRDDVSSTSLAADNDGSTCASHLRTRLPFATIHAQRASYTRALSNSPTSPNPRSLPRLPPPPPATPPLRIAPSRLIRMLPNNTRFVSTTATSGAGSGSGNGGRRGWVWVRWMWAGEVWEALTGSLAPPFGVCIGTRLARDVTRPRSQSCDRYRPMRRHIRIVQPCVEGRIDVPASTSPARLHVVPRVVLRGAPGVFARVCTLLRAEKHVHRAEERVHVPLERGVRRPRCGARILPLRIRVYCLIIILVPLTRSSSAVVRLPAPLETSRPARAFICSPPVGNPAEPFADTGAAAPLTQRNPQLHPRLLGFSARPESVVCAARIRGGRRREGTCARKRGRRLRGVCALLGRWMMGQKLTPTTAEMYAIARAPTPMSTLPPSLPPGTLVVVQDAVHTTGIPPLNAHTLNSAATPAPPPTISTCSIDVLGLTSAYFFWTYIQRGSPSDRRVPPHQRIRRACARPVLLLPKFFANTKFERVHAYADTHVQPPLPHPALPVPHPSSWSALRDRLGVAPAGGAPNSMGVRIITGSLIIWVWPIPRPLPPTPPTPIPLDDRALMLAKMACGFHLGLGFGMPDVGGPSLPSPRINANGGDGGAGHGGTRRGAGDWCGPAGGAEQHEQQRPRSTDGAPVPLARAATSPSSSTSTASTSRVEFQ